MLISVHAGPDGGYVVQAQDGRQLSVTTDWDFPPLAKALGWSGRFTKRKYGTGCSARLQAAADWLDKHLGRSVEDPGYFEPLPAGTLTVELAAVGNPDFGEPARIGVPRRRATVGSLQEASAVVRQYINQNGLGSGNWAGGTVRQGKRPVARVSYNGRVWSVDGSETSLYTPSGSTRGKRSVRANRRACRCRG
jgi:hypothetical protein